MKQPALLSRRGPDERLRLAAHYAELYPRLPARYPTSAAELNSTFSDKELRVLMSANGMLINSQDPETGKYTEKTKAEKVEALLAIIDSGLVAPEVLKSRAVASGAVHARGPKFAHTERQTSVDLGKAPAKRSRPQGAGAAALSAQQAGGGGWAAQLQGTLNGVPVSVHGSQRCADKLPDTASQTSHGGMDALPGTRRRRTRQAQSSRQASSTASSHRRRRPEPAGQRQSRPQRRHRCRASGCQTRGAVSRRHGEGRRPRRRQCWALRGRREWAG